MTDWSWHDLLLALVIGSALGTFVAIAIVSINKGEDEQ